MGFYVTIMFVVLVIAGTVIARTWITAVHPSEPAEDVEALPLVSLDGHILCRGCHHPLPRPNTKITMEIR